MEDIVLKNMEAIHRKPRKSNHIKSTWSSFKEFAASSNLHGLKYFSEKISIVEKLFWAVTFIGSIILCSLLIYNVWYKWRTSPVIVSINEEVTPVWKVPFPAITICPQQKCNPDIYNYTEMYINLYRNHSRLDENTKNFFDDISSVCGRVTEWYTTRNITNASSIENILSVAPKIKDVFKECIWREEKYDCKELFREVLTKEGLCFTFNTQHVEDLLWTDRIQKDYVYLNTTTKTKDWSYEKGYKGKNIKFAYPRVGRENGPQSDLIVDLNADISQDQNLCNMMNFGFRVYMHNPADIPQSSLYYYAVLPKTLTALAARFNKVSTSESLESYSPEIRQCYFPSDRKLKYFKVYTQRNCELECLTNYTYEVCKCVWFHMPHDNSSEICSTENISCIEDAKIDLSYDELDVIIDANSETCDCLPACDSVTYDAEVLKTAFNYKALVAARLNIIDVRPGVKFLAKWGLKRSESARLEVFFKESRFVSMRRSELFGTTDFLANCGGLLGLFMGFSFLSIVEIVYFFIVKVLYKIWHSKNNKIESTSTDQTTRTTRSEDLV